MKPLLSVLACAGFIASAALSATAEDKLRHYAIGDLDVIAIRDANSTMEKTLLPGLEKYPEAAEVFSGGPAPAVVQTFYWKSGAHTVLVDAGWGQDLRVKGNTVALLREIGSTPEEISDILLTHLDLDHIGGLLAHGKAVYPHATLWIAKSEYDAWIGKTITNRQRPAIDLAQQVVTAYKDKVHLFEYGDEIIPGVRSVDATGHTPGHTAYDITSGTDTMTIAGDVLHIAGVQLLYPELSSVYDVDQVKAASTRQYLLERAAVDKSVFSGMHFPMIGTVRKIPNGGFEIVQPQ